MGEYTPTEEVVNAWTIEGKCPEYHEKQKDLLRKNWPTLYDAIQRLVSEEAE